MGSSDFSLCSIHRSSLHPKFYKTKDAVDVCRPASIKQLQILGERVGVEVFSMGTDADPVEIAAAAVAKANAEGHDAVLIDAAGCQVIDAVLMDELKRMKAAGEFQSLRSKLSFINGADFLSFFYSQSLGDSSCC
jgi:hypothetical protein